MISLRLPNASQKGLETAIKVSGGDVIEHGTKAGSEKNLFSSGKKDRHSTIETISTSRKRARDSVVRFLHFN